MDKKKIGASLIMILVVAGFTGIPVGATEAPVELSGRTTYVGQFAQSGFVFAPDWYNYCSAVATLTRTGRDSYDLQVDEWDCGRVCTWELKITEGGVVKGEGLVACDPPCVNGSCAGEIQLHTGCPVEHGTFPIYHGTWDGNDLDIATHFHGRCDGGTYWGQAWFWDGWGPTPAVDDPEGYLDDGVNWDDGPAHMTFGLELTATE